MLPELLPILHQRPFVFFGHSMGAWLAYQATQVRLRRCRRCAGDASEQLKSARVVTSLRARTPPLQNIPTAALPTTARRSWRGAAGPCPSRSSSPPTAHRCWQVRAVVCGVARMASGVATGVAWRGKSWPVAWRANHAAEGAGGACCGERLRCHTPPRRMAAVYESAHAFACQTLPCYAASPPGPRATHEHGALLLLPARFMRLLTIPHTASHPTQARSTT